MRHLRNGLVLSLCLAMALTVASGCSRKKKEAPINPDLTNTTQTTAPETTTGEGLPGIDQSQLFFGPNPLVKPVYFDYDSYALRPDALSTLQANAEVLKQVPNVIVQVEGHCDERGTQEYNLALGEKRALATREQLVRLGISGDRIVTISYGEEMPADTGHNEDAWSKNRRCQFNEAKR